MCGYYVSIDDEKSLIKRPCINWWLSIEFGSILLVPWSSLKENHSVYRAPSREQHYELDWKINDWMNVAKERIWILSSWQFFYRTSQQINKQNHSMARVWNSLNDRKSVGPISSVWQRERMQMPVITNHKRVCFFSLPPYDISKWKSRLLWTP